jgi:hypothetical protein
LGSAPVAAIEAGLVEDPVEWARLRLGFEADAKRAQVLRSESGGF